ncbi:MAG: hypothetical protein IKX40_13190 [Thermoguttaceae bacterium]|nr:hypothetical protein [Thermoguttaceae bacterium]
MEQSNKNKNEKTDEIRNLLKEVGGFDINQPDPNDFLMSFITRTYLRFLIFREKNKRKRMKIQSQIEPYINAINKSFEKYIFPILCAILTLLLGLLIAHFFFGLQW